MGFCEGSLSIERLAMNPILGLSRRTGSLLVFALLMSNVACAEERQKVILDTDMGQLNDDAYALFMLANSPEIDLLGVMTCTGNVWGEEAVAFSLRHLEMVGRPQVPVLRGVVEPIMGLRGERIDAEERLFGKSIYLGAYGRPRPESYRKLAAPPYGGYAKTEPAAGDAVDFLVTEIKRHPHEVTLLVIGPPTNLAIAVRKNPEIVPLVKQVVYMGGAIDVPGNTTPAAEFNFWFDPEAARICLRTPFRAQMIVPLDICEKVFYTKVEHDRVAAGPPTPLTRMFRDLQGPDFVKEPERKSFVWDSLAAAILIRPKLAVKMESLYLDVDATYGPEYGRSLGYRGGGRRDINRPEDFPQGAQRVSVLMDIDRAGFWDLFVELMTAFTHDNGAS
jgi:inosine-uridine nucleoside N-ribohydrolase